MKMCLADGGGQEAPGRMRRGETVRYSTLQRVTGRRHSLAGGFAPGGFMGLRRRLVVRLLLAWLALGIRTTVIMNPVLTLRKAIPVN